MNTENILNRIAESIISFPQNNAFCIKHRFYTYLELKKRIAHIQVQINSKASEDALIGVIAYDAFDTYAAVLAILFLGKGYVPIHPEHPLERNDATVSQSGIRVVISSSNQANEIINCNAVRFIDLSVSVSENAELYFEKQIEDSVAYLLFTSGTTGIPKGVPISRKNLNAFFDGFYHLGYPLATDDRCLQMFDLTFDLSVMSFLAPLSVGACVYTVPSGNMKFASVFNVLEKYEITFALMVPSFIQFLQPYFSEVCLEKMKVSLFCGEALNDVLVKQWLQCLPNAIVENVYGPTEATIFCSTYACENKQTLKAYQGNVCIGKPMKHDQMIIVDEHQNELEYGEKGELCLSGAQLTNGYWNNPEKNAQAFFVKKMENNVFTFYRTGDICFKDVDGDIHYCGRLDHQVKIQGYRVELGEIEHHARNIMGQGQAVAVVKQTPSNALIYLFVENCGMTSESILKALKEKIPSYMVPVEVILQQKFPLNSNGKTDKNALLKQLENL